jgi:hypothetical protein
MAPQRSGFDVVALLLSQHHQLETSIIIHFLRTNPVQIEDRRRNDEPLDSCDSFRDGFNLHA